MKNIFEKFYHKNEIKIIIKWAHSQTEKEIIICLARKKIQMGERN